MSTIQEIEAVAVRIVDDITPAKTPLPAGRDVFYSIYKTYQSKGPTGDLPENILPASDKRVYASVTVLGVIPTNSNIYLCGSQSDAQPSSGNPVGVQLQPGMTYPVMGTSDVWLVSFGAGAAPLVSVQSVYKR
jgi:hypothetical protein